MRSVKKLLAWFMVLCMILGVMPNIPAYAAEPTGDGTVPFKVRIAPKDKFKTLTYQIGESDPVNIDLGELVEPDEPDAGGNKWVGCPDILAEAGDTVTMVATMVDGYEIDTVRAPGGEWDEENNKYTISHVVKDDGKDYMDLFAKEANNEGPGGPGGPEGPGSDPIVPTDGKITFDIKGKEFGELKYSKDGNQYFTLAEGEDSVDNSFFDTGLVYLKIVPADEECHIDFEDFDYKNRYEVDGQSIVLSFEFGEDVFVIGKSKSHAPGVDPDDEASWFDTTFDSSKGYVVHIEFAKGWGPGGPSKTSTLKLAEGSDVPDIWINETEAFDGQGGLFEEVTYPFNPEDPGLTPVVDDTEMVALRVNNFINERYIKFVVNGVDVTNEIPGFAGDSNTKKWNILEAMDESGNSQLLSKVIFIPAADEYAFDVKRVLIGSDEDPDKENAKDYWPTGNFLWSNDDADKLDDRGNPTDIFLDHTTMEFVKFTYEDREGNEVTFNSLEEMEAANHKYLSFDPNENKGGATLIADGILTVKMIPKYGYQVVEFGPNGESFETEEEPGTYTFKIASGNFHLGAKCEPVEDTVDTCTVEKIYGGSIEIAEDELEVGTALLEIEPAETTEGVFGELDEKEIIVGNYDINFNQVIYKGCDEDSWKEEKEQLDHDATITLKLSEDINVDNVRLIHEKITDGVSKFEDITLVTDMGNNSVTFKTDSFSNYTFVKTCSYMGGGKDGCVSWSICDGIINIYGDIGATKAPVKNVNGQEIYEWLEYADSIKTAVIEAPGVESMSGWFENCKYLETVDCLATDNVTDISRMFKGCQSLWNMNCQSINAGNKITDFSSAFEGCKSIKYIGLTNVSCGVKFNNMFKDCISLEQLYLRNWEISDDVLTDANPDPMGGLLTGCNSLKIFVAPASSSFTIDLPVVGKNIWKDYLYYETVTCAFPGGIFIRSDYNELTSGVFVIDTFEDDNGMWTLYSNGYLHIYGFGDSENEYERLQPGWLSFADKIRYAKIGGYITNTDGWFSECYNLISVDAGSAEFKQNVSMNDMFAGCYSLKEVNWDGEDSGTISASSLARMYKYCESIKFIDMSRFVKADDVSEMFVECNSLEDIFFAGSFDTSKVISVWALFSGCEKLKSLDLSSWNTENIKDFSGMITRCESLESIDISNFVIAADAQVDDMLLASDEPSVLAEIRAPKKNAVAIDLPVYAGAANWVVEGTTDMVEQIAVNDSGNSTKYELYYEPGLNIIGIDEGGYTYTGSAIVPDFMVTDGKTILKAGIDYTVSIKNNIKANDASVAKTAPTITVKGKGNYTSTKTVTFKIRKAPLYYQTAPIDEILYVQGTGKAQAPLPVLTFAGKKLAKKTDFTFEYVPANEDFIADGEEMQSITDPGNYLIRINGEGNFGEYIYQKIVVTNPADLKVLDKVAIGKIADKKLEDYPGGEVILSNEELNVLFKGKLECEKDFEVVSYENNDAAGTATVVLKGISTDGKGYIGSKTVTFKIKGISIAKATVVVKDGENVKSIEKSYVYNSQPEVDEFGLMLGENVLAASDFALVAYKNVDKAGNASLTFEGKGKYEGKLTKTFKITPMVIEEGDSSFVGFSNYKSVVNYKKNGANAVFDSIWYFVGDAEYYIDASNYTVKYANNKEVTTSKTKKMPTMTITFKGNYKGKCTREYVISQGDLISQASVNITDVPYANKANNYINPLVVTEDAKKLTLNKDYAVAYRYTEYTEVINKKKVVGRESGSFAQPGDIVPEGTCMIVMISGTGNPYSSYNQMEYYYMVSDKTVNGAKVSILNTKYYTGEAIELNAEDIKVTIGKNTELVYGEDYEIVDYTNNVKTGKATAVVRGIDKYFGAKTITFNIKAQVMK